MYHNPNYPDNVSLNDFSDDKEWDVTLTYRTKILAQTKEEAKDIAKELWVSDDLDLVQCDVELY